MDSFKIDNFNNTNPTDTFPNFEEICESEIKVLKSLIWGLYFKETENKVEELILLIDKKAQFIDFQINTNFSILKLLKSFNLSISEYCYINWDNFQTVDKISMRDLDKYWSDIWYPAIDDIEIFSTTGSWILKITHYGSIALLTV